MMSREAEQDLRNYAIAMELANPSAGPIKNHPLAKQSPEIAVLAEEIRKARMNDQSTKDPINPPGTKHL